MKKIIKNIILAYDAIYDDGDYDEDRYGSDPDYTDGVDDAMDEFDEDWQEVNADEFVCNDG